MEVLYKVEITATESLLQHQKEHIPNILLTGLAVGGIGKAAGLKTEEAVVLGAATAAITYGVTKYMASQKQKQTAEVNAIRVQKRFEQEEKKIPRYMAVSTLQDKGVQGGESVMIWDTESQAIVGKQVYHIKEVPELYTIIKLDDYETTYVGS